MIENGRAVENGFLEKLKLLVQPNLSPYIKEIIIAYNFLIF